MSKKKSKNSPRSQFLNGAAKPPQKFIFSAGGGPALGGKKWHKILIAIFLFLFIPTAAVFAFEQIFTEKIYPGVKIGELKLGGKTKMEALAALNQAAKQFNEKGVVFVFQNQTASLLPIAAAASDPDLSRTIFILENEKTVEETFNLGRGRNLLENLKDQIKFLVVGQKIKSKYQLNRDEAKKILKENFKYLEKPALDAKLAASAAEPLAADAAEPSETISAREDIHRFEVLPEEPGLIFDYEAALNNAFLKVAELKNEPTALKFIVEQPKIKMADTALALQKAQKMGEICPIILSEAKKTWTISKNQIRDWLEFQNSANGLTVGFNKEKTKEYLAAIAKDINAAPEDAKFKIENGTLKEFKIHHGGKELDIEASYTALNNFILNFDETKISASCQKSQIPEDVVQLIVKIIAPQIPIGSVNNLGIQELVGVGKSNFSGSPQNRRHNIKVGATKLNGVLIAPGEEFSTNKSLGEISGATGYLQELVIKGDRTIPEFGGGLCQIGTTMFRVALDAGLPITERRPHAYRVSYYEPAGMDATIYGPKPDLKFLNDTPAYLLLQTKIEGDDLTFELWGTSDGRKVEISKPKIYNFVSPGPTKIIETEDLKPGEKKCTERAHTGADAEFSRAVTSANNEVKTETWKSRYVPWSAVCLVGKEPTPSAEENIPPTNEIPIGTPSLPPETTNTNAPAF